jgi:hypothetical protein
VKRMRGQGRGRAGQQSSEDRGKTMRREDCERLTSVLSSEDNRSSQARIGRQVGTGEGLAYVLEGHQTVKQGENGGGQKSTGALSSEDSGSSETRVSREGGQKSTGVEAGICPRRTEGTVKQARVRRKEGSDERMAAVFGGPR